MFDWFDYQTKLVVDEADTYEQRYNAGCNYAAVQEWKQAEAALTKAEEVAKEFLAGDAEEEIEEETGIIRVQLGYVLQCQGREKEAQTIYNQVIVIGWFTADCFTGFVQVLKGRPGDIGLVAVASNNLLTLNRDQNIFDRWSM